MTLSKKNVRMNVWDIEEQERMSEYVILVYLINKMLCYDVKL